MHWIGAVAVINLTLVGVSAAPVSGDASRGKTLFVEYRCIECHAIMGQGGKLAADLGTRLDRAYTPAEMASLMWNHAPAMWKSMRAAKIDLPQLTAADAADLFAFFYSAHYFEKPGDAGRGKHLFESKGCAGCHGLTFQIAEGKQVASWQALVDPIALVQQMWNHATQMQAAFSRKGIARPEFSAQELTDVLVYLQHLPQTRNLPAEFSLGPAQSGESLFRSKGCAGCHHGKLALENRLQDRTLTEIAAQMWNHAPRMAEKLPLLELDEMRQILQYVWARAFFQSNGDARRGERVFTVKGCAACHRDATSGAPNLTGRKYDDSPVSMLPILWKHGPSMLEKMQSRSVRWPRFNGREMQDLVAYLHSLE